MSCMIKLIIASWDLHIWKTASSLRCSLGFCCVAHMLLAIKLMVVVVSCSHRWIDWMGLVFGIVKWIIWRVGISVNKSGCISLKTLE